MSRHRDIRNMDYSDDYNGYDDVFGHSVEDDYYISPSNGQFIYNRELSTRSSESDIKEEDEFEADLTDLEKSKVESCIDQIKETLGGTIGINRNDLINIIRKESFNIEKIINTVLEMPRVSQMEPVKGKDDIKQQTQFNIPNFNSLQNVIQNCDNKKNFIIPNIFGKTNTDKPKFVVPKLTMPRGEKTNFVVPKLGISDSDKPAFRIPGLYHQEKSVQSNTVSTIKSQIDTLSSNVERLQVSNLPYPNSVSSEVSDEVFVTQNKALGVGRRDKKFQIDLSVALKNTNSVPSIKKISECADKSFDIPFIDGDRYELFKQVDHIFGDLETTFDISGILKLSLNFQKRRSKFGRVICRKYKNIRKPTISSNSNSPRRKPFDFSTESPDNIVLRNLKR